MKQLEKKFEEIEKLIEFGNYEEALSIIKKWEKEKPISNIKAMEIKILKSLYYNTISKYDMALAIADQLLKESIMSFMGLF